MIKEVLSVIKILQQKVYLSKDVTKRFSLNEGQKVVWYINENNELVLSKSDKLNTYKTELESMYSIKK